ncbi:pseudouridine-5'-phosphate glycosidase [Bdellovibrio sp. SKB1291214]|uniref:pseudouridine-5'-phosphate glycosidase n=1 Tax=Bdellovibrio sp. SKB1291214 TaxID=1732569 RepID=UPI000B51B00E|nr:pseudouridine-5'-phosphate glycosidase [Bdellovibrio sp. SKB1291214]UYL08539.1 pseudouridine-5'-phosphate glycosidase [Bdellovibrio sp. SKB1291214]
MKNLKVQLSQEVEKALSSGQPVVALESTIISHGMPYPQNFEMALAVEDQVRKNGATPATIAIIDGVLRAGLLRQEIESFAKKGMQITKVSRRDIPVIVAQKKDGATTVASTMIIAELAGISIFATGGIGGVHRGAEESMDISADLEELGQTNVAVICAGAKSILDIGLTLEYLETKGVPVLGYQTSELPAFYTRESGFKVDSKVDSAKELAQILRAKWDLGLKGGVVIANPVPKEYSLDFKEMEKVINDALAEMNQKAIKGKDSTPFLLGKVKELTAGKSLETNIQLVLNNAKLAAEIAVAYCRE